MPRTKIAKGSKRNRETAIREEKIRDYDANLEHFLYLLGQKAQSHITVLEGELRMLIQRAPKALLQTKIGEFMALNLKKFNDWTPAMGSTNCTQSLHSTLSGRSLKPTSSRDEGYLTEENSDNPSYASSNSAFGTVLIQQQQRGRTPGPLSSARERRVRRSRSACGDFRPPSALKPKPTIITEHTSRNKMRTPVCMRTKTLSADRSQQTPAKVSVESPVSAFMRWPKPGELVVSKCGSPIVAQVMPDKYANVNIPVKNGMLSLRPKKLTNLKPELIDNIDAETLNQIRTLHANLNLIVNMADKAATK